MTTLPRGIRNFNPGNIDYNKANAWNGQLGLEILPEGMKPRFARFDTAENGIRALGKLLRNYRGKDGLPSVGNKGIDTTLEVANRWAPGSDGNNVKAYAEALSKRLGNKTTDIINLNDKATVRALVVGIITHENGMLYYSNAVIDEGVRRAFL